jgi:hypothetical protein
MTTTLEHLDSFADSGESAEDRRAHLEAVLSRVAVSHYEDTAVQQDQMPFTD